ncbi:MAG: YqhA family protein [Pseudomonadota bacterium]
MSQRSVERAVVTTVRRSLVLAVLASFVGAGLMILIGLQDTADAVLQLVHPQENDLPVGDAIAVRLISALDRFVIAVVLLYFGFGIYSLFVRPNQVPEDTGVPGWLDVQGIGQLKQTLAETIIVVLFVLFLRVTLETFIDQGVNLEWPSLLKLLTLPAAIFLLSASLRLAELHPKTRPHAGGSSVAAPKRQTRKPGEPTAGSGGDTDHK